MATVLNHKDIAFPMAARAWVWLVIAELDALLIGAVNVADCHPFPAGEPDFVHLDT